MKLSNIFPEHSYDNMQNLGTQSASTTATVSFTALKRNESSMLNSRN